MSNDNILLVYFNNIPTHLYTKGTFALLKENTILTNRYILWATVNSLNSSEHL